MKRDLDLVRSILLHIEQDPEPTIGNYCYAEADAKAVAHNLALMLEHGLIEGNIFKPLSGLPSYHNVRLTWAGSDFLDAVRDEAIWRETKAGAAKVGGATFELLKQLASGLIKTQIEKHTGVKLGT